MTSKAKNLKFEEIKIGDRAYFKRKILDSDIETFSKLSGDFNPLHNNEEYSASTEFKGMIVHGMFLAILVSRLVGMEIPGKKSLLIKQGLDFKNPVRAGDEVLVCGTVVHKSKLTNIIELAIEIKNGAGIAASGSAYVRVLN